MEELETMEIKAVADNGKIIVLRRRTLPRRRRMVRVDPKRGHSCARTCSTLCLNTCRTMQR